MDFVIEIAREDDSWQEYKYINEDIFKSILKEALTMHQAFKNIKEVELSILLTNDKKMQILNNDFRAKNKPTNVLSFPDNELHWRQLDQFVPDEDYLYLGDVAFGCEIIAEEAKNRSIGFKEHFYHLAVHAILHLLGYDHEEDEDDEKMKEVEIKTLSKFNIESPY